MKTKLEYMDATADALLDALEQLNMAIKRYMPDPVVAKAHAQSAIRSLNRAIVTMDKIRRK